MFETLDVRTLILILTLGHAIAALLLFFATMKRSQIYDTVFMISMSFQAAGWLLLFFRGIISDTFSFSLGDTLIFSGFCLESIALLSLVRPVEKNWQRYFAAVLALSVLIIWLPLSGQDQNVGIVSFVIPLFFLFPGMFLVFSSPRPSPLQQFTGSILLFYIIAVMVRGTYLLVVKDYSLLTPTIFQVLFLSGQFIIMVLASTGYILIRRELVSTDLEDEIEERQVIEAELKEKTDSLQERVKELNCLYDVARLIETTPSDEALLPALVNVLPAGWRYPDLTVARITVKEREFLSEGFQPGTIRQESVLTVYGTVVGSIEVFFTGDPVVYGTNPFLPEESSLLLAIAERISRMLERHWSEVTLRESEEKYRRLFEQVSDAIFIADTTTRRLTDCNQKAEILTGYTRDEILAMSADELHPPDIRTRTVDRFRDFLEGWTGIIETEVITRDGKRVPVSINATPLEFGGSRYLVGIFRDISWQKEVQRVIAERTEEVDRFFTTSLDLFCIADTDGYFRRLNPEWEKVLGWPVAELEGKKFLDYVHPDDVQATLDVMQELEHQNEVTGFINRYRHRDGSWRWIEWRSAPSGTRIFVAARDITRHYLDEHYNTGLSSLKQELLISAPLEDKLRMITDACVSLFHADFARIWMIGPGDLCQQGCIHAGMTEGLPLCPDHTACLHLMVSSGRYSHTDGGHRRVPFGAYKIGRIATGEEPSFITNDVLHDSRVHDHAWAASLGLVSFAGFRLLSAEGKPMGVLAFFSKQQISPNMMRYVDDLAATASHVIQAALAEEALRESEEQFRRLISRSFDAIVVHQDGRIVLVNDSAVRIIGASKPGDLVGKPVIDLVHPDDRKTVAGRVQKMLASKEGTVPLMEEKFLRIDGTPIHVAVMATATQHNGRLAVMVVFRDITEQKEAEQALETAKKFSDTIIDSIPGIFYVFDEEGHFVRRNPNHRIVTGYSDDELHQITALDTIAPEDRDSITGIIGKVFSQQGFTTVTVKVLTKDGRKIPYLLGGLSMTVAGKKYLVGTGIDITEQVRAQEALRESEDRFSRAIDGTGAGLWDWDMVNDIVFFSARWKSMLGYEDHEIANNFSGWKDLWNPDDAIRIEKAVTDYLEGRTAFYEIEHRLRHKDGSWHWILTRGDIHRDTAGRPIRWVGTNIDITRMKNVEEELSHSRQMLQLVIDSVPQRVFWKDTHLVYLGCNLPLARDAGYSDPRDLVGKDDYSTASKEMADQYRADDRRVMETGVSRLNYEEEQVKPDGNRAWLTTSKVPLRDSSGTVIGVLGTYEDITLRKQMEQALRESEEKFRAMIENIPDFVYQVDMSGNFIMVNPAGVRMLGYDSMDQMIGLPVTDVYANPDDRKLFLDALNRNGSVSGYPIILKSRNGTILHVIASSHYFRDANGVPMGVEGVLHDLTDLHRAEEGLRMANHKLNLLSSITRHDIMNQLQGLYGYIHLCVDSLGKPGDIAGYLAKEEIIARNIQRQIEFTRDYEDLGVKSPVWQDVSQLAKDVSTALLMQDIQMVIDCPGLEIFADPLLYKVFYNLTDNALHYGGGKMTVIHLFACPQEEDLHLIFEDDGEGISISDKQKLFTKGFGKHTGLGLFLSREILSITGITITENGEPGNGARFEMRVPRGKYRHSPDNS